MTTHRVSNQSQLNNALDDLQGGDTILLESGTYSRLEMITNRQGDFDFNQKVTIASANAGNPAKINDLLLRDVNNVEFNDVEFNYDGGRDTKPFFVEKSSNVTFDDVRFDGQSRNGYGYGTGLSLKESQGVEILNSVFNNFEYGMKIANVEDIDVSGNTFSLISQDGAQMGGIQRMLLSNNSFINFKSNPNTLHKDAVQFLSMDSQQPSKNIDIIGNYIDNPENTHGFYFGNRLFKSGDMKAYYEDIYFADNKLYMADKLAITLLNVNGVLIENNTLEHNKEGSNDDNGDVPLINVSIYSWNVTIRNNDVASVQNEQNSTWSVYGNDTDARRMTHWEGVYNNTKKPGSNGPSEPNDWGSGGQSVAPQPETPTPTPVEPTDPSPDSSVITGGGEIRLKGDMRALFNGGVTLQNVDFEDGDEIVFAQFDRSTFRDREGGNAVNEFDGGQGVRIDSALDLRELVASSPDVSARTDGDRLILTVDQGAYGSAKLTLEGMGSEYRAADNPDLF